MSDSRQIPPGTGGNSRGPGSPANSIFGSLRSSGSASGSVGCSSMQTVSSTASHSGLSLSRSATQGRKNEHLWIMLDADNCLYNQAYRQALIAYILSNKKDFADVFNAVDEHLSKAAVKIQEQKSTKADTELGDFVLMPDEIKPAEKSLKEILEADDETSRLVLLECIKKLERKKRDDVFQDLHKESNGNLLAKLSAEASEYQQATFLMGSARWTFLGDWQNREKNATPLYFDDIKCFIEVFKSKQNEEYKENVKFDATIITDMVNQLPPGETHARYKQKWPIDKQPDLRIKQDESRQLYDRTKASSIYAMSHRAIKESDGKACTLMFVDDREDIINTNFELYSQHPELLPANLTLKLVRYDGSVQTELTIHGKGKLDHDYACSAVKLLMQAAPFNENGAIICDVAEHFKINPQQIASFIEQRDREYAYFTSAVERMSFFASVVPVQPVLKTGHYHVCKP